MPAHPPLRKGIFWMTMMAVAVVGAYIVGFFSFLDGVDAAMAGQSGDLYARWSRPGINGDVRYEDGGFVSFSYAVTWWVPVWLILAYLVGGRYWRVVRPRRGAVDADGAMSSS